jgi:hypothetical protein
VRTRCTGNKPSVKSLNANQVPKLRERVPQGNRQRLLFLHNRFVPGRSTTQHLGYHFRAVQNRFAVIAWFIFACCSSRAIRIEVTEFKIGCPGSLSASFSTTNSVYPIYPLQASMLANLLVSDRHQPASATLIKQFLPGQGVVNEDQTWVSIKKTTLISRFERWS